MRCHPCLEFLPRIQGDLRDIQAERLGAKCRGSEAGTRALGGAGCPAETRWRRQAGQVDSGSGEATVAS